MKGLLINRSAPIAAAVARERLADAGITVSMGLKTLKYGKISRTDARRLAGLPPMPRKRKKS